MRKFFGRLHLKRRRLLPLLPAAFGARTEGISNTNKRRTLILAFQQFRTE
jgi:hypothetical protein